MSQFGDLAAIGCCEVRGHCRPGCRMLAGLSYLDVVSALRGGRVVYLELCSMVFVSDGFDMIGRVNAADC